MIPEGRELKRLRKSAGLTQKRLAEKSGFSQALIARIERGSVNPTLRTMQKIYSALSPGKQGRAPLPMMSTPVIYVLPGTRVREAIAVMEQNGISQMPVMDAGRQAGSLVDSELMKILGSRKLETLLVRDVMSKPFPEIAEGTDLDRIAELLRRSPAVLVMRGGAVAGIITRADFLRAYFAR